MAALTLLLVAGGTTVLRARQPERKKTVTVVFDADVTCENCVRKIMNNVPSLGRGIRDVRADVGKGEVTVLFDPAKNSVERIARGLASLRVAAEPKSLDGRPLSDGAQHPTERE